MNNLSYNHLFKLIDDDKTFTDIGDPQNVLKTAAVMNFLMIVITISLCMVPIPLMAPVIIIIYIVSFCVLNIKYMRDFTMGVYQSDNLQIQGTKTKYDNSKNKITDLKDIVEQKLESDYRQASNFDQTLSDLYVNTFQNTVKSMKLFSKPTEEP